MDEISRSMAEAANRISEQANRLKKSIGDFVLRSLNISLSATVKEVKPIERDNYGRCLYYVTVNITTRTKNYYVLVYDVDTSTNTYNYDAGKAILEDITATGKEKQEIKDNNNWNKKF